MIDISDPVDTTTPVEITIDPTSSIPTGVEALSCNTNGDTNIPWHGFVSITWNIVENADYYKVYYSTDNVNYTFIKPLHHIAESFLAIDDIAELAQIKDKPIYFKVTSVIDSVESAFSEYTTVLPTAIPAKITGVKAAWCGEDDLGNNTMVRISWNLIGTKNSYKCYYSTDNVNYTYFTNISGNLGSTSFYLDSIPGLSGISNTTVYFKVTSVMNGTESAFSEYASVKAGAASTATPIEKVANIIITSPNLSYDHNAAAYATYEVYDQDGKNITNDSLAGNLMFNSSAGTVTGRNGFLKLADANFVQSGTVTIKNPTTGIPVSVTKLGTYGITIRDANTGIAARAMLTVLDFGNETK
ncbi:hypothetical protein [Clostridium sp.]|uniref:hypothetical protein n=1 Tax=Clostridium sp. TaxID=1506 RepID=UPI003EEF2EB0